MKVVEESPAPLTNAEVLSVLKERASGAASGTPSALKSEAEVIKTLEQRGTVSKTREELAAFAAAVKADFQLTPQEIAELVNHVPTSTLDIFICLESAVNQGRVAEEDLDRVGAIVAQHLK